MSAAGAAVPSPSILDVSALVTSLWGGLYMWEIVQSIPLDWKIVTGKRGCLWGSLLFYFPFRILAAVSFITGILRAYPLTAKQSEAVGYIEQSTNLLARVVVFHIFCIRISAIWKNWMISYAVMTSIIALEIVSLYGISRIRGVWFGTVMPSILAIYFLCLATAILFLTVFGLLRARTIGNFSPPGSPQRYAGKPLWYILFKEKAYIIILVWISQTVSSLAWLSMHDASDAMTIIGLTNTLIIFVCGSRAYQCMITPGNTCPMDHVPSIVASVMRGRRGIRASMDAPRNPNVQRSQERRVRWSEARMPRDRRISIHVPEDRDRKDAIELQTFSSRTESEALPSSSRLSLKTAASSAQSSSTDTDIHLCKRTPSPSPSRHSQ